MPRNDKTASVPPETIAFASVANGTASTGAVIYRFACSVHADHADSWGNPGFSPAGAEAHAQRAHPADATLTRFEYVRKTK